MAKIFGEIGCVFCGGANNNDDDECKKCGKPLQIHNNITNQMINNLKLIEFRAQGFYGLTYKAIDPNGKLFAVKIISVNTYKVHEKDFAHEAEAYATLPDHSCIARYIGTGNTSLAVEDDHIKFYFILSEWIHGDSLKAWMNQETRMPNDLYSAGFDLFSAIMAFEEVNLWHNDLHEENILVQSITESQRRALRRDTSEIMKIVDIGSARFKSESDVKEINDLNNIGRHLMEFCTRLTKKISVFSKEDQIFLKMIPAFCARLTDEDRSRGFGSARDASDNLIYLWENSRLSMSDSEQILTDPYGLINAMDIRSPKLIKDLFTDQFQYFTKIENIDHNKIVITGPRGCGKTMILKRMSYETAFSTTELNTDVLSAIPYIGIFISARTQFGNYLVAVRNPEWTRNQDMVGLYFNVLVTINIVDLLYRLVLSKIETATSVQTLINFVRERYKLPACDIFSCRNYLVKVSQSIVLEEGIDKTLPSALNATPAYIDDLVGTLTSISSMRGKDVVLLIDDLSWPRIPECVMKILAPFIFNTGSIYKVRLSAHSDGFIPRDLAGEEYKANRDFTAIDLGREYYLLSEDYQMCIQGFDNLMDKRFQISGRGTFPGLEAILGAGDDLKEPGTVIRQLAIEKKLRTLRYHGAHIFVKLCSGDLSYLVELLGAMSIRWGGKTYPIGVMEQHDVIRNYARTQLRLLNDLKTEEVSSLYQIGLTFGLLSKTKLIHGGGEYLRIEVELVDITDEMTRGLRELLSSGLFIDGGYSNNYNGVPCRKLLFRRIYTPAFPTTVNNRDTLPMTKSGFLKFIKEPGSYVQAILSKNGLTAEERQRAEQVEMFDE